MSFHYSNIIKIIFKDLFLLNHNEKVNAYFNDFFLCEKHKVLAIQLSENVENFGIEQADDKYNFMLEANINGFQFSACYQNRNPKLYSIFKNTIFESLFIQKTIIVSKDQRIICHNGTKTVDYPENDTDLMNSLYFLFNDFDECHKKYEKFNAQQLVSALGKFQKGDKDILKKMAKEVFVEKNNLNIEA